MERTSRIAGRLPAEPRPWTPWTVFGAGGVLLLALAVGRAWVGEDAFITYRTVRNAVEGYGLRWNVDERVQTYTHPLWMLLQIPFYALTREVCTTTTAIGLACSAGAYALLGARHARRPLVLGLGVVLPLALSRAFVTYSTSGFENPLSHLLLAAFAALLLRRDGGTPWTALAFVASLGALNRLDTSLVLAPPLVLLAVRARGRLPWGRALLAAAPLWAWLAFALVYYGFLLPNPALAKINPEIPLDQTLLHGAWYLTHLALTDPASCALLGIGIACGARAGLSYGTGRAGRDERDLALAGLGLGVLAYVLYAVWIGGDFLAGRFFSVPVVASVVLWSERVEAFAARPLPLRRLAGPVAALALAAVAALLWGRPRLDAWSRERQVIPISAASFVLGPGLEWRLTPSGRAFWQAGLDARASAAPGERVVIGSGTVGMTGFAGGPDVIVVDHHGLADPLLARLPPLRLEFTKAGHHARFARGYLEARVDGSLEAMHPELAAYYRPLWTIVNGPLFSRERWLAIARFHLGAYDRHLEAYLALLDELRARADAQEPAPEEGAGNGG